MRGAAAQQDTAANARSRPMFARLVDICGEGGVLTHPDELEVYDCDAYTLQRRRPMAVIFPTDTQMVSRVMACLAEYDVPIVARGAGTSLAGGCLPPPNGMMISTARMRRIFEIDARNRFAHVEAGVTNQQISDAACACGLFYAPDPSSQIACTIGGNVATNAGGPHTLKHGVTVNHILGLTAVLPDGRVISLGGPCEDVIGCDVLGAFVGCEGTFGIVTEVIVRLTPKPAAARTLLAVYDRMDDATETVTEIIAAGHLPVALEMMDRLILEAVEAAFGFGFDATADAALIVEVDGIEAGLDAQMAAIESICRRHNARNLRMAADDAERAELWKCRKHAAGALGRITRSSVTQDGVVPRSKLPETLRYVREVAARYDLRIANVFHAGDGNLHPIILFDERNAEQTRRVLDAGYDILARCVELGGTVTGEHGIGVEKTRHIRLMFNDDDLAAMDRLRRVFDPTWRCNPNKVFPGDWTTPAADATRPAAAPMNAAPIVHDAADLTVEVRGDVTLTALDEALRQRGQWLPVDSPRPDATTIASLVANAASGPFRFGYGTIRDYVLSMHMTLADGTRVKSGARVAKNTAGFEVHRLFIGGEGAFGTIESVGLRVRPIPQRFAVVLLHADDAPTAAKWLDDIMTGPLRPVMLDLLTSRAVRQLDIPSPLGAFVLAVGFDGLADTVEWQCDQLAGRGGAAALRLDDSASRKLHAAIREWPARDHVFGLSASMPSSRIVEFASQAAWLTAGLVARAGNGVALLRADQPIADEAVRPLVDFAIRAGGSLRVTTMTFETTLPRVAGRQHDPVVVAGIESAFATGRA